MLFTRILLAAFVGVGILTLPAVSQSPPQAPPPRKVATPPPRLVPVAETKLLMDALNQSNFQGLERILKQKQIDAESWTFARGQALLIAETGNLLMMRPPKNSSGTDAWMKAAMELRESASQLSKTVAARDQERGKAGLVSLANACNNCHQTFRVSARISVFDEAAPAKP
jgi:hypothetical protein